MDGEGLSQRLNLTEHRMLMAASLAAGSLLLTGCGLGTGTKKDTLAPLRTRTVTKVVSSNGNGKTTNTERIVTKPVHDMQISVLGGEQLEEVAIADIEAEKLPYSTSQVESVEDKIIKLNKGNGAVGQDRQLKAGKNLNLPVSLTKAGSFHNYLAQQGSKTNKSGIQQKPVDGYSFAATVSTVTKSELGKSWHRGCPIGPDQLSAITMTYDGFDHKVHTGELVVNKTFDNPIKNVFAYLFYHHFPIREMVPLSSYGGSDTLAVKNDDTSDFNCRDAVATGPKHWSLHAYGDAVDVNDRENPYELNGKFYPDDSYKNRSDYRPGMSAPLGSPNGTLTKAFDTEAGWSWGGDWTVDPDYQHYYSPYKVQ
jgi:hypothetical protein